MARAASWLRQADGLLITAGAGMGIDSGLPDFRGPGFLVGLPGARTRPNRFRVHCQSGRLCFRCEARMGLLWSSPRPLPANRTPRRIWPVARHRERHPARNTRLHKQRRAVPESRIRLDTICEVHGLIHHLQCAEGCSQQIWSAENFHPDIDSERCRLVGDLPHCPHCGALARPNILMFGDWGWIERRTTAQYQRLQRWLVEAENLVCIEIGAGTNIPTVRHFSEDCGGRLIRINPAEPAVTDAATAIGLPIGGMDGISRLHKAYHEA